MGVNMEDFTISDLAQAVVLGLGAMGSLLLVVWQSRCGIHCRLGCSDNCYLCDCKREPPADKDDKKDDKKDDEEDNEDDDEAIMPNDNP